MVISLVIPAFVIAVLGSVWLCFRLARAIAQLRTTAQQKTGFRAGAAIGVLIAFLPTLTLAVIIGGTLGGGWGEAITEPVGLGSLGVPLGIMLGMGSILVFGLGIGTIVGGLVGAAIGKLIANT